eukprot:754182-Hanusia_phi.AAC.1
MLVLVPTPPSSSPFPLPRPNLKTFPAAGRLVSGGEEQPAISSPSKSSDPFRPPSHSLTSWLRQISSSSSLSPSLLFSLLDLLLSRTLHSSNNPCPPHSSLSTPSALLRSPHLPHPPDPVMGMGRARAHPLSLLAWPTGCAVDGTGSDKVCAGRRSDFI